LALEAKIKAGEADTVQNEVNNAKQS